MSVSKKMGLKFIIKHKLENNTRLFICQFDSLYKIDTKVNQFDTIIVDEFMTCVNTSLRVLRVIENTIFLKCLL